MADDESTSLQEGSVTDDTQDATAPPEGKNPYDITDPEVLEKINSRIEKKLRADRFTRSQFEWEWFRNIVIAAGQHDIVRFRGVVRLRKAPDWYPRTYTNKFAEKYRDLLSALLTGRVPIRYLPATDNPEDQGTADVGERVRDVIYSEAKVDGKENEIGTWFVLTGNVFLVPYYDYDDKYGSEEVPKLECQTCGNTYGAEDVADDENGIDDQNPMCPYCQNAGLPNQPLTPSKTETDTLPIGSLCVDVVSPFEIRGDTRKRDYHEWTWFCRLRRYDSSYAKEKWGWKTAESDTDGSETTIHYLDVLSQISDSFNPQMGIASSNAGGERIPKVTAYEYYELPSDDFPEGLRVVRLGKDCEGIKEAGPLTTEYGAGVRKGKKFLPLSFIGAECVPGRFWRKSPLTDAVPLQTFRNLVERAIKLEFQRMANSVWLNPKGSGVNLFNGEAGWICNYNPLTLGGTTIAKPERVPPQLQHLQMMIELLKFIDDAIERVTGTYFLQGGEAPSGVTAACVDAETYAMTRNGWKTWNALTVGEDIYAFNSETGKGEWSPIKNLHIYPDYEGEMWEFDGRDISFNVTPNHKWPNTQRYKAKLKDNRLGMVEMRQVKKHHRLPARIALNKKKGISNSYFAELVGWVVTEGSYTAPSKKKRTKHWEVRIHQSMKVNSKKCEKIQNCLDKCGITYRIYDRSNGMRIFLFNGEQGDAFVKQFPDKRPGYEFINSLSQRQLCKMLRAMVLGDGHKKCSKYISPHGNDKNPQRNTSYMSCDPELAEQFQYAAVLAGFPTALNQYDNGQITHRGEDRYESIESWISLKKMKFLQWQNVLPDIKQHQTKQLVWCPETTLGTWIARRKGKAYVTGNSALALL